jgi:uncharacterized protein (DUF885 family)
MRGLRLIVAVAALGTAACAAAPPADPNAAFRAYEERFVAELMAQYPDFAVQSGDYRHAARQTVPDERARAGEQAFLERHAAELARHDPSRLDPLLRADHGQIRNFLESSRWRLVSLRQWAWDPSTYNVAPTLALLLNTEYAPLDERLRAVLARLDRVPAYYAAARASVSRPTREHTQLAIQQNRGALEVFGEGLQKQVDGSGLSAGDKALFRQRLAAARAAVEGYAAWLAELEPSLTPDYARSFRLGRPLYEKKFGYDIQSSYTVEELYARAQAHKEKLLADMEVHARALWPRYFGKRKPPADRNALIAAVIDKVSQRHSRPEAFVDDVRAQIPQLEAFVREKDLLDQDPTKPLVVRETPPYNPVRGVAIASIDAPGPFDPGAATYYNVNPMSDFTPERQQSFLREYNHWMMQILNIHEAIPGHYTQLLHANRSPSVVKALLGSGPMIEGWAVYAELMMLENGWGQGAHELWLMRHKFNLRATANTILDYSVHVLDMSEAEALKLLMQDAFQTETEARGKWRRVQLTSVQLTSYFAGFSEILEFREQQKAALGDRFSLKDFHNRFLSYGSVPVKTIRELMGEPATAIAGQ